MIKLLFTLFLAIVGSSSAFAYYMPYEGRFLSRDPIEEEGGVNLYATVGNNPILYWDILGLDKFVYDGSKICRLSDDGSKCKKCWEAASGKPDEKGNFDYSEERQKLKNIGPIPEGKYLLPSNITTNPDIRGTWDLDDWNNYAKNRAFYQTRVDARGRGPWGRCFGRLEPQPETDTFGRSNFNVHGGTSKGSAGCIDIGNNDKEFFDQLRMGFVKEGEVKVIVDYSGSSTKSCKCVNASPAGWKD
ncbi:MAG: hypothetical protein BWY31_00981 [Lentisphaerae bacterium ADurb.Bin242]|nr:MAG: hypothetical protein BWY31_00981 [Lentisphaerae bacterium ADurb.Bin242]